MRASNKSATINGRELHRDVGFDDDRERASPARGGIDLTPQVKVSGWVAFGYDGATRNVTDAEAHSVPKQDLGECNSVFTRDGESLHLPSELLFQSAPAPGLEEMAAFSDDGRVPRSWLIGNSIQSLARIATKIHDVG
jgi:hypothetical protein